MNGFLTFFLKRFFFEWMFAGNCKHRGIPKGYAASVAGVVSVLFLLAFSGSAQAATNYVDADATGGDNSGTNWANAYLELTNALANAGAGDEIWVAKGTYSPGPAASDSFYLTDHVVYGGFTNGAAWGDRDPATHVTILDGGGTIYHVVEKSTTSTATLDGFVIQGGRANGTGVEDDGGGLYLSAGDIVMANCVFTNNSATVYGGDIYFNSSGADHVLTNCTFTYNGSVRADYGGAVYFEIGSGEFRDCSFTDYAVDNSGGAVGIDDESDTTVTFDGCSFTNNSAPNENGGAVYMQTGNKVWGPIQFNNCTFNGNSAGNANNEGGGAIYALEGDMIVSVTGCVFTNNSGYDGGVIAMRGDNNGATVQIFDSQFYNNSATGDAGGAVYSDSYGKGNKTIVSNCWFEGNTANSQGGALYIQDADGLDIIGCTFPTNQATTQGGHAWVDVNAGYTCNIIGSHFTNGAAGQDGGAIAFRSVNENDTHIISNCTFNGNVAGTGSGHDGGAIYAEEGGSLTVSDTVFTNNTAGGHGGAIALNGTDNGMYLVADSTVDFFNNVAGQDGGAIYIDARGKGTHILDGCTVVGNSAGSDGGAFVVKNTTGFEIKNITFPEHTATAGVGGHLQVSVYNNGNVGLIENCTFEDGTAGTDGGSIRIDTRNISSTYIITNCTFDGNVAGTGNGHDGGAIYAEEGNLLTVSDTVFTNNTAGGHGGAIALNGTDNGMYLVADSTVDFFNNVAGQDGGAIYIDARGKGTHILDGCTVVGNSAGSDGGAFVVKNTTGFEIKNIMFPEHTVKSVTLNAVGK